MTAAQTKAARHKNVAKYGKRNQRSVQDAIEAERAKAAREAKKSKIKTK
jgi:hypothetical protein